jgi:hypothetical protein
MTRAVKGLGYGGRERGGWLEGAACEGESSEVCRVGRCVRSSLGGSVAGRLTVRVRSPSFACRSSGGVDRFGRLLAVGGESFRLASSTLITSSLRWVSRDIDGRGRTLSGRSSDGPTLGPTSAIRWCFVIVHDRGIWPRCFSMPVGVEVGSVAVFCITILCPRPLGPWRGTYRSSRLYAYVSLRP